MVSIVIMVVERRKMMPKYNVTLCNMKFREKDYTSQYGNFKIFLYFRFYRLGQENAYWLRNVSIIKNPHF